MSLLMLAGRSARRAFARRRVRMPLTAQLNKIQAKYENGVLELHIPKDVSAFLSLSLKACPGNARLYCGCPITFQLTAVPWCMLNVFKDTSALHMPHASAQCRPHLPRTCLLCDRQQLSVCDYYGVLKLHPGAWQEEKVKARTIPVE